MDSGNVAEVTFPQSVVFLKFGRWQKKHTCISPITILSLLYFWLKLDETVGAVAVWNLNIGNFAKCTEWSQTELKESDIRSTLHIQFPGQRVHKFNPFHSTYE